ncbi:M20 family metallopeptidase [Thermasporomyces composti]|uniref:Probable succinyl-diaminopimelate desuccinylase n=1 Tax=Thermasporomyces composti TaxID=696763 RepID=A0A3D9VAW7_THECX|nr:M20 family metallopeptidase [Thermasporomyces composti]REF37853.1 succinyl-diaminopimelate desuccinylase [Thermasporomyces composti]
MTQVHPKAPRTFPIDEEKLIELTRALVRVRSVHEPAHGHTEAKAAALVADTMRDFGWEPVITEVAPGRPNVVAVVEGGGGDGPTLAFVGHTDVVTEGDPTRWTVDPFGAELRDGRIYGRGSADMKGGLAAMLHAVRALQLAGPFPGRVKVCAFVDEEGLMLGAKHFAASEAARDIDAAIVCEPEQGEICVAAKGAIRLRIDLLGAMAHGAMPQHGRNPIVAVGRLLDSLSEYQQHLQDQYGRHRTLGLPYLTPTVLEAGSANQVNVIPSDASVYVDVRTIPGVDHQDLVRTVTLLAQAAGAPEGVAGHVTVLDDRPPVEVEPTEPVVVALAEAHEAVVGSPARYGGVPGATDGTILTRDAGIPTVVYGPGGKWIAHQADEYVEVADLVQCAKVYAEAADRFLRGNAQ